MLDPQQYRCFIGGIYSQHTKETLGQQRTDDGEQWNTTLQRDKSRTGCGEMLPHQLVRSFVLPLGAASLVPSLFPCGICSTPCLISSGD